MDTSEGCALHNSRVLYSHKWQCTPFVHILEPRDFPEAKLFQPSLNSAAKLDESSNPLRSSNGSSSSNDFWYLLLWREKGIYSYPPKPVPAHPQVTCMHLTMIVTAKAEYHGGILRQVGEWSHLTSGCRKCLWAGTHIILVPHCTICYRQSYTLILVYPQLRASQIFTCIYLPTHHLQTPHIFLPWLPMVFSTT